MHIKVKLFGPLGWNFPGYDASMGMDVVLPDGARISDLLAHLEIPEGSGYLVSMDNRVKRPEDILKQDAVLHILPALAGG